MTFGTKPPQGSGVYKALLDHSADIVTLLDDQGFVTYQSNSVTERLGHTPEEMLGEHIFDYLHPDDVSLATDAFNNLIEEVDIDRIVVRIRNKSGQWNKLEVVGRQFQYEGQQYVILNTRDVTDHQTMLERLRDSEQMLNAAFNAAGTINSVSDFETGEFLDVNDGWTEGTGWSREEGLGNTALVLNIWGNPENRKKITGKISIEKGLREFPATFYTKSGEEKQILVNAEIIPVDERNLLFVSAMDITEHVRTENELRQAQRLESIGQLTGGIAHDLNNMLTVILGQIDLYTTTGKQDPKETLDAIREVTERGSELIAQLMIFSRRQTLKPRVINVSETVQELRPLLDGSLGGEIHITLDISPCADSYLDRALLESALLNLAINARDAMTEGGHLTISVHPQVVDEDQALRFDTSAGDFINISVIDDGSGMSEETIAIAVDPFFTTKAVDKGTGLGLSMVFGFVKQSGGHLALESTPGEGTTVSMLLPTTSAPRETVRKKPDIDAQLSGQTVLLIEDNDELRRVITELLLSFGCEVIECDGIELGVIDREVTLILSDVVLPGARQGPELAAEAKQMFPDASVLFMSGYPKNRLSNEILEGSSGLLVKPFSRDELYQRLNEIIAS